ncbi:thioredoxin family protein [Aggregatimonas sangjinii]|uniref:Thioredoxin family protein n=1 Tax=Aggregatimonas sangjinii TaxID=2583587 RepID=A0A5B7SLE2_9FLAO|nr:thioredoxin family protein [Aggregatimonas sangjinii]QCW98881.1 thioredoxin family protein [Aggregatimonas sangjinii]
MRTIQVLIILLIPFFVSAQSDYQTVTLENGSSFLIGKIDVDVLKVEPHADWYRQNHSTYEVDQKELKSHQKDLDSFKILVFMGTWCGDSKREVPRFIKILETLDFPMENLKIVALDRRKEHYKKSPTGEEWGLSIIKVPTFIFYRNGKEWNRIVESPIESLEKDMAKIITEESYTPNYTKTLHSD